MLGATLKRVLLIHRDSELLVVLELSLPCAAGLFLFVQNYNITVRLWLHIAIPKAPLRFECAVSGIPNA